jgi:PAS domain-containing protein
MPNNKNTLVDSADSWINSLAQFYQNGALSVAFARFNGDIVAANNSFLDLFGFSKSELVSGDLNWKNFTPYEFLATTEAIDKLKNTGNSPTYIKDIFAGTAGAWLY